MPDNASGDAAARHAPQHAPAGPHDADLARVVAAWPELPEPIRRAVLALIGSAAPQQDAPAP